MLASRAVGSPPRVLVVEDEVLVGMLVQDMLEDLGYAVVGPIGLYDAALGAARTGDFDCAIVDLNLGGKSGTGIADVLAARNIPFIFATGYGHQLPNGYHHVAFLQKPFRQEDLEQALSALQGVPFQ